MFSTSIPWYFTAIEIGAYIIALLLLWHAWQRGKYTLLVLIIAMVYGYVLEAFNILTAHAYYYNQFHVMLPGGVPLSVGVSWAIVITAFSYLWRYTDHHFTMDGRKSREQLLILLGFAFSSIIVLFIVMGIFSLLPLNQVWIQRVLTIMWIGLAVAMILPAFRGFKRDNPFDLEDFVLADILLWLPLVDGFYGRRKLIYRFAD